MTYKRLNSAAKRTGITDRDRAVMSCANRTIGLFVPKPSRRINCQRRIMPDLGTIVRQRLLASTAGTGDCYSLGYSAPGRLRLGHLDANLLARPCSRPNGPGRRKRGSLPRTAVVGMGCCTQLLYWMTCPNKEIVEAALTPTRLMT